jgi:hypothetical protein
MQRSATAAFSTAPHSSGCAVVFFTACNAVERAGDFTHVLDAMEHCFKRGVLRWNHDFRLLIFTHALYMHKRQEGNAGGIRVFHRAILKVKLYL